MLLATKKSQIPSILNSFFKALAQFKDYLFWTKQHISKPHQNKVTMQTNKSSIWTEDYGNYRCETEKIFLTSLANAIYNIKALPYNIFDLSKTLHEKPSHLGI